MEVVMPAAQSGTVPAASTEKTEEAIVSRIYDATVIGEPMALGKEKQKVWEKLMNARIVYLGEAEQVPISDDRELELEIVKQLRKRCAEDERPLSLALEAFPSNLQEQLNQFMDNSQDEDEAEQDIEVEEDIEEDDESRDPEYKQMRGRKKREKREREERMREEKGKKEEEKREMKEQKKEERTEGADERKKKNRGGEEKWGKRTREEIMFLSYFIFIIYLFLCSIHQRLR